MTRFSGGRGCASLTVGLDDPTEFFQPKRFRDSKTTREIPAPAGGTGQALLSTPRHSLALQVRLHGLLKAKTSQKPL